MSSLATEFKKAWPVHTDLNKEVVQAVRLVLCAEQVGGSIVLASLPRSCIFYFLELCQLLITPDDDGANIKV
ncbi:uncharacterized protein FSUBG_7980 [Fusarium subglutinans]|uniref:Uncharacterized protein n=1 Tax=Gibberella subglutinans TaxID=42677 RepID=A0A8H5PT64_GIBSU|nr:uncharacterized protein FSUBG_7980 [Fusarium subglutinans]KAF5601808.1 hypothetical protein FSUBG_7980 [Fusarium subglutinans]